MPAPRRITARSRQDAMDLSLLLLSQGIEPIIDPPVPEAHWGLLVPEENLSAANTAIDLYRSENRKRPWRREISSTGVLFDWASLAWVGLIVLFYWLSVQHPALREAGVMRSEAVSDGRWELLFTATWLHADPGHLAMNAVLGLVLLGLAMGRLGSATGLLAAALCGAGGNLLAWAVASSPHHSLGASGLVMGCLGLLAPQPLVISARLSGVPRRFSNWKSLAAGFAGAVMLFVLLGVSPGSDVVAHFGGFLTGLALGTLFLIFPGWGYKPIFSAGCSLVFLLLTLWPWYRVLPR